MSSVKTGKMPEKRLPPGPRPLYDEEIKEAIRVNGFIEGCDKMKLHTVRCRARFFGYRSKTSPCGNGTWNIRFIKDELSWK
jgi:hypothetical protein